MNKIQMITPLVEMDGDEMTRVLWKIIKDELILPFVDLKSEYYDLGLENRNATDDKVTFDSAYATKKYGVAVKCATITPASEMKIPGPGKVELVYTSEDGTTESVLVHEFKSAGIVQGMHNLEPSIESFARSCFNYALDTKKTLWFATKDTISKKYDHTFKDIFNDIFENEYKEKFYEAGIEYFYTLIDDAVARVMKSKGGFIWACKNYDGDVMSDMLSSAFGSLAMMTSVLVSPSGVYEYEAAHGTVQRHYYKHLKGEETSTNSVATIFAWTGALRKRGELDSLPELVKFADKLEEATISTIESGKMTKDLALITNLENVRILNSGDFIRAIRETLEKEYYSELMKGKVQWHS